MRYKKKYIKLLEEFKDMEVKHFIEKKPNSRGVRFYYRLYT
jgi:hypothetical protein